MLATYRVMLLCLVTACTLLQGCVNISLAMVKAHVAKDIGAVRAEIALLRQDQSLTEEDRNEQLYNTLRMAAEWSLELTRELVEQGVPILYPNNNPEHSNAHSVFYSAVKRNQLAIAHYLIEQGADVNRPIGDENGTFYGYPLTEAIARKSSEMVKLLLAAGANPNVRYSWDTPFSPLDIASHMEDKEIANRLIEAGAVMEPTEAQERAHLQSGYKDKVLYARLEKAIAEDNHQKVSALLAQQPQLSRPNRAGQSLASQATQAKAWKTLKWMYQQQHQPLLTDAEKQQALVNTIMSKDLNSFDILLEQFKPQGPLWQLKRVAIEQHQPQILRRLLTLHPSVNPPKDQESLLFRSVMAGHTTSDSLQILLNAGVEVDPVSPSRYITPLAYTVENNQKVDSFTQLLLKHGAQGYKGGLLSHSALYKAIQVGNLDIANTLFARTLPLEQQQKNELLTLAVVTNQLELTQHPKLAGAKLNHANAKRENLLIQTMHHKDSGLLEYLLGQGLSPLEEDSIGATPLHAAASQGFTAGVHKLLELGANPLAATYRKRYTPLQAALRGNHTKIVNVLLPFYTQPDAPVKDLKPLLFEAVETGNTKVASLLLPFYTQPGAPALELNHLMNQALRADNPKMVNLLLPYYPQFDAPLDDLTPLLLEAVKENQTERVTQLLALGLSPDSTDRSGYPLLYLAIDNKASDRMLRLLLAAGANPNLEATDKNRPTPIMVAAAKNFSQVKILMSAGANLNQADYYGRNAMDHLIKYASHYCRRIFALRDLGGYPTERRNFFNEVDSRCFVDESNTWVAEVSRAIKHSTQTVLETQASVNRFKAKLRAGQIMQRERHALERAKRQQAAELKRASEAQASFSKTSTPQPVTLSSNQGTQKAAQQLASRTNSTSGKRPITEKAQPNSVTKPVKASASAHWAGVASNSTPKKVEIKGSFQARDIKLADCTIPSLDIQYAISGHMGDPFVGGRFKFEPDAITPKDCIYRHQLMVWLKVVNGRSHGYVKLSSGSPMWSNFICGFEGTERRGCLSAEQAKPFIRGARVSGYKLSLE